jgi:hypothetical protein
MIIILKLSSLLSMFGSKFRGFKEYLQSGDGLWPSEDEKGHRIGHHFMDIYNMFSCKCKSLW